ncbi:MAG TPA: NAD(P)/FAD-dependent oxidoreductase [Thermomicrobiales bacterium]|nr:NAD(P)/FAD-dependent oxidoreductase [Thermomicrobiales bacterium]
MSEGENRAGRIEAEVLVVGGGPAGLSAALYLARFDRRVILFDAGQGRSTWHQINHNYLGFPGGIAARDLRELGRRQLGEYPQVTCLDRKITELRRDGDWFVATGQAGEWRGRAVVVATGVVDHYPHFEGWDEYVGRSMFWCITCDGYACKGERVVVIGNTNATASEAMQLCRFTDQLTLLTNSSDCAIDDEFQHRLDAAGIPLIHDKIDTVHGEGGFFKELRTEAGRTIELDQLFAVQGQTPQTELIEGLGVDLSPRGYIKVDSEQKTNLPGVYAAGDVTRLHSHQISTAVHEGGQAASAANYFLYPPELKDE